MGVHILVVDDEPALLALVRRYLERLGYAVDTAASAPEALAMQAADATRHDLVIADLTLEGMTGEQMLERMRERNPKLRGLISSGYPYEPKAAGVGFLLKPYVPEMLVAAVEKALGSRGTQRGTAPPERGG